MNFPIFCDPTREIAVALGMLEPGLKDSFGMPLTARNVFIISPDRKVKLLLVYPASTGRNFDELLRVVDSLQLSAENKLATPVNWRPGEEAMVLPGISDEEALSAFNSFRSVDLPSGKAYMRFVDGKHTLRNNK